MLPTIEERKEQTEELADTQWYKDRPQVIKDAIKEYPPYNTYLHKPTDKYIVLVSLEEDKQGGAVTTDTIMVSSVFNPGKVFWDRRVFAVPLTDLKDLGITEPWLK